MSGYAPAFQKSRDRLRSIEAGAIALASLCPFDQQAGGFQVPSLGRILCVSYPEGLVTFSDSQERLPMDWALIVLNYLSSAKAQALAGEWVSYRGLPQGRIFASNIRKSALEPLADFFSRCDKTALRRTLDALGFVDAGMSGDLTAKGSFAPRVPVAIQFWEGEDEIRPECQILFDRTVTDQMHVEDIAVMCGVIRRLLMDSSPT